MKIEGALNAATLVVAVCAVVTTGLMVRRQFGSEITALPSEPPVRIDDWKELAAAGHRMGPHDAHVVVVVWGDFECPACQAFATSVYPALQASNPGRTALVYRHWPLSRHRFAYSAAKASECAAEQGRFHEYHDLLYRRQRELGLLSFDEFASEAGVPDLQSFSDCYRSEGPIPVIEADITAVRQLGGTGTPTVAVNGWLIRGNPTSPLLDSIARGLGRYGSR